ncbi:uncharacterized protein LOC116182821 [Photinus pyralis]|uniref:uncharacterized protein LOC116182821 n=1 Tax=Photinus pyralis TaxID=7054 RepID=UPI00126765CB|nr:uncharacterized protein LOC116182821 [Photinus pyralis]
MLRSSVVACQPASMNFHSNVKKRRIASKTGKGLINNLINNLPVELHLPGYQFCGPGTRLSKRLARGDRGINPLDEACRDHDIAYSRSSNISDRHEADKNLQKAAWERFRSRNATFGEKAAALTVAGIMKGKRTLGMGTRRRTIKKRRRNTATISFNKGVQLARKYTGGNVHYDLNTTVRRAVNALKKKKVKPPKQRILPIPKTGGFIPLIPLFAALGAAGSLGGAAAIARAVNGARNAAKQLEESKRHNEVMEAAAIGKGLYLKPYKTGLGLYLNPYQKNFQ